MTLSGHTDWITSVAFSPGGSTLASASRDKTIRLWDVRTGADLQTLSGHTGWVNSIAFSPDGFILASGSSDGMILLWHSTPDTDATQWSAIPTETTLLPNYPNPLNPLNSEIWIPYRLAERTEVKVTIHDVNGRRVYTLVMGHQPAGYYLSKNRAAFWNGRNQEGEPVANGLYFCTLTASDFTATRKMVVRR